MEETEETKEKIKRFMEYWEKKLPRYFLRSDLDRLSDNIWRASTVANKSAIGLGPEGAVRVGRKVILNREDFLAWVRQEGNLQNLD